MRNSHKFDVIVIGGGPGGAVAAKRCAEKGMTALLIEKKKIPRDKVCTGMVMGDWAHDIIRKEFGEIPTSVLADPPYLTGHRFHVPGAETRTLEWSTALAWRKDLDTWMLGSADEAGVTVRDGCAVVRVALEGGTSRVTASSHGIEEDFSARFVIGADGGASVVRRSLFPDLSVRYSAPIRECYRGALDLDANFIHWFFPTCRARPRFNVNHKDDVFLIEGSAIKGLRPEIAGTLGAYGFDPESKPEWKDACAVALLHAPLLTGRFVPASANTLLVGDAAGLILPITFEGIGCALKSGLAAAESILGSADTGSPASAFYLDELRPIIEAIRRLCDVQEGLNSAADNGSHALAEALSDAYRETLTIQSG